jgi:hypothetical protein
MEISNIMGISLVTYEYYNATDLLRETYIYNIAIIHGILSILGLILPHLIIPYATYLLKKSINESMKSYLSDTDENKSYLSDENLFKFDEEMSKISQCIKKDENNKVDSDLFKKCTNECKSKINQNINDKIKAMLNDKDEKIITGNKYIWKNAHLTIDDNLRYVIDDWDIRFINKDQRMWFFEINAHHSLHKNILKQCTFRHRNYLIIDQKFKVKPMVLDKSEKEYEWKNACAMCRDDYLRYVIDDYNIRFIDKDQRMWFFEINTFPILPKDILKQCTFSHHDHLIVK